MNFIEDVLERFPSSKPAVVSISRQGERRVWAFGELIARSAAGEVLVLDVRPAEEYAAGHIPGAISIPVAELGERIAELPVDTDIVVYCRGEYCALAYDAVRLLNDHGRRGIRLHDGMLEWRLADLPVETADLDLV